MYQTGYSTTTHNATLEIAGAEYDVHCQATYHLEMWREGGEDHGKVVIDDVQPWEFDAPQSPEIVSELEKLPVPTDEELEEAI